MPSPSERTVFIFTSCGMGHTDNADLKIILAKKFLALVADPDLRPAQICFYTDGVRLCVDGSPVLGELRALADMGVNLLLCSTCLERFGLNDRVAVGTPGGMDGIVTAMMSADRALAL